jgi:hypothetical protein
MMNSTVDDWLQLHTQEMRAEIERLRMALTRIRDHYDDTDLAAKHMAAIANAALASPESGAAMPAEAGMADRTESFVLIAMDDDNRAHIQQFATEAERDEATLARIWDGGRAKADPNEAGAFLDTMRDCGVMTFEGDPPIYWFNAVR